MEIFTQSPEGTQRLAKKIAKDVKKGGIICLYGDLGSGKTVFVQGLAKALGLKRTLTSPTFVTMKNYGNFYHLDLYRVNHQNEIKGLDLIELFSEPENIISIEWAEKIKDTLPKNRFDIYFDVIDENTRKIFIFKRN